MRNSRNDRREMAYALLMFGLGVLLGYGLWA